MMGLKLASLFAGIGGFDLGLEQVGMRPVWANEKDPHCAITFKANFPKTELVIDDICNIKASEIPDIDILTGGFPCQPFSVAGYRKGFEDERGGLFFQIVRLIEELKQSNRQPKVVFLENVKNLFSHNKGKTYAMMKSEL